MPVLPYKSGSIHWTPYLEKNFPQCKEPTNHPSHQTAKEFNQTAYLLHRQLYAAQGAIDL